MTASNNGSANLPRLHVLTRNIKGYQACRASSIDRHAWSLSFCQLNPSYYVTVEIETYLDIQKVADAITEDCWDKANCSIWRLSSGSRA